MNEFTLKTVTSVRPVSLSHPFLSSPPFFLVCNSKDEEIHLVKRPIVLREQPILPDYTRACVLMTLLVLSVLAYQ